MEKGSDAGTLIDLPAVLEKHQSEKVFFSADGLLLLFCGQKQKTAEPWLRLFWDYEPPKKTVSRQQPEKVP